MKEHITRLIGRTSELDGVHARDRAAVVDLTDALTKSRAESAQSALAVKNLVREIVQLKALVAAAKEREEAAASQFALDVQANAVKANQLKAELKNATVAKEAAHASDVETHRALAASMKKLTARLGAVEQEKAALHANDTRELDALRARLARAAEELDEEQDAEEDLRDDLAAARAKLQKLAEALAKKSHELQTRVGELQMQANAAEQRTQKLVDEKEAALSTQQSDFQRELRAKEIAEHDLREQIEANRRATEETHASDVAQHGALATQLSGLEVRLAQAADEKAALEDKNASRAETQQAKLAALMLQHDADTLHADQYTHLVAMLRATGQELQHERDEAERKLAFANNEVARLSAESSTKASELNRKLKTFEVTTHRLSQEIAEVEAAKQETHRHDIAARDALDARNAVLSAALSAAQQQKSELEEQDEMEMLTMHSRIEALLAEEQAMQVKMNSIPVMRAKLSSFAKSLDASAKKNKELTQRVRDVMAHNEQLAAQIWTATTNAKMAREHEAAGEASFAERSAAFEAEENALKAALADAQETKDATHANDVATHRELEARSADLAAQLAIVSKDKEALQAVDASELDSLRARLARVAQELHGEEDAKEDLRDELVAARAKLQKLAEELAAKSHELQGRVDELQAQVATAEQRTQDLINEKQEALSTQLTEFQRALHAKEIAEHDLREQIEANHRATEETHASDAGKQIALASQLGDLEAQLAAAAEEKAALERDDAMRLAVKEAQVADLLAAHSADSAAVDDSKHAVAGLREVIAMQKELIRTVQEEGALCRLVVLSCSRLVFVVVRRRAHTGIVVHCSRCFSAPRPARSSPPPLLSFLFLSPSLPLFLSLSPPFVPINRRHHQYHWYQPTVASAQNDVEAQADELSELAALRATVRDETLRRATFEDEQSALQETLNAAQLAAGTQQQTITQLRGERDVLFAQLESTRAVCEEVKAQVVEVAADATAARNLLHTTVHSAAEATVGSASSREVREVRAKVSALIAALDAKDTELAELHLELDHVREARRPSAALRSLAALTDWSHHDEQQLLYITLEARELLHVDMALKYEAYLPKLPDHKSRMEFLQKDLKEVLTKCIAQLEQQRDLIVRLQHDVEEKADEANARDVEIAKLVRDAQLHAVTQRFRRAARVAAAAAVAGASGSGARTAGNGDATGPFAFGAGDAERVAALEAELAAMKEAAAPKRVKKGALKLIGRLLGAKGSLKHFWLTSEGHLYKAKKDSEKFEECVLSLSVSLEFARCRCGVAWPLAFVAGSQKSHSLSLSRVLTLSSFSSPPLAVTRNTRTLCQSSRQWTSSRTTSTSALC